MSESYDPRPQPPVLVRDGFKLDCEGDQWRFTVNDIERMEASRLAELFAPESYLSSKREQNAARKEADRLFLKTFHIAQLRHYGIDFRANWPKEQLHNILRDAVLGGQCQYVPESILNLQLEMQTEYDPDFRSWEVGAQAWDERERQRVERQRQQAEDDFARLTTPTERARKNPDRFLKFHFFPNGCPDQTITPRPLALVGLDKYSRMALHRLVEESYPGIHTQSGGADEDRALCIGWSRYDVLDLAYSLDGQAREKQRREQETEHEAMMESHRQYVSSLPQNGSRQPFDRQKCTGSYYVQCDSITSQYSDISPDGMWLDIGSGTGGSLEADFNFGIIEGTMLLDFSDESVAAVAYELDPDDEDEFSEDEEEEEEEEEEPQSNAAGKRAAPSASGPAKKQKTTAPPSRRLYFRMRGRETGEGEIFHVPEPGHIEFLDDDCTQFVGSMYDCCLLGKNVEFRGFKIDDEPEKTPEDWTAFSYKSYQYERKARWRR